MVINLQFVKKLPVLLLTKPLSIVVMDNASIHIVATIVGLIERQHGARVCLPSYSPDVILAEGVFSQVKSAAKEYHKLFQVCSAPAASLA